MSRRHYRLEQLPLLKPKKQSLLLVLVHASGVIELQFSDHGSPWALPLNAGHSKCSVQASSMTSEARRRRDFRPSTEHASQIII